MSSQHNQDLVRFLAETAQEVAAQARNASAAVSAELAREAEELLALRDRLVARIENANQLQLPLELKAAA